MPKLTEHACRLIDPKTVKIVGSEERKSGKGKIYRVLFGIPKAGGGSKEQAYRYPTSSWTELEARTHCKEHKGTFEAALKATTAEAAERIKKAKERLKK